MITWLVDFKTKALLALTTVCLLLVAAVKWYANKSAKLEVKVKKAENKLQMTKLNAQYKSEVLKDEAKTIKAKVKEDAKETDSNIIDRW